MSLTPLAPPVSALPYYAQLSIIGLAGLLLTLFAARYYSRASRLIVGLATIAALALSVAMAWVNTSVHGFVLLALLKGDLNEVETTKFREGVQHSRVSGGVTVDRYYKSIDGFREAMEIIGAHPKVRSLAWGDVNWLYLMFSEQHSMPPLFDRRAAKLKSLTGLEPVLRVRLATISFGHREAVTHFVSALWAGLEPPRGIRTEQEIDRALEARMFQFQSASNALGKWKSNSHRALSSWILGNGYLALAISGDQIQKAYLACAWRSFARALQFLPRPSENPALAIGIHTQRAIVQMLFKRLDGKTYHLASAKKEQSIAYKVLRHWPRIQPRDPPLIESTLVNAVQLKVNRKNTSFRKKHLKLTARNPKKRHKRKVHA